MDKILSVSIAAYNVEKYLKECLEPFTVSNEVLEMCEVLIVDDGSKDSTAKIAGEFVEKYPDTFKLIQKENGGWGSTVNTGIKNATGKYFKQLDGDDYFSKENLELFLRTLREIDCDMVITPMRSFEDGTGNTIKIVDSFKDNDYSGGFSVSELPEKFIINMHYSTFLTDMLKNNHIRITEHAFYTDVEFVVKAFQSVKTIYVLHCPIYQYRLAREGQSVGLQGMRKHYKEHLNVIKNLFAYIDTANISDVNLKYIKKRLKYMLDTQYDFFFSLELSKEHKREFKDFDKWVKAEHYDYYSTDVKKLDILRKSHFMLYYPISKLAFKKLSNT
jgi:glycosyltransferase involved in cell wall biosynthesis